MALNLKNKGYRFRIYLFAGLMVLLIVISSAFTIGIAWHSKQVAALIVGKDFKAREIERALVDLLLSMDRNQKQYLLLEKPEYKDRLHQDAERFRDGLIRLGSLGLSESEQKSLLALQEQFDAFMQRYQFPTPGDFLLHGERYNIPLEKVSQLLHLNQGQIDLRIDEMKHLEVKTIRVGISWAVLSLLVAGFLSFLLIHSITHPIGLLRKGTHEIAEGRFSHRVHLPTQDEMGMLANAFNDMAYQLKRLDDLKADFMAIISHELKTPLTSMKEAVELLLEEAVGTLNTKQRHLLNINAEGIQKLARFIDEILSLTRMEGGMVDLYRTWFDFQGLLEDSLATFHLLADKKRIHLTSTYAPEHLPPVYGDADRLKQVMANLLSNAIRFTPYGGQISVHIEYVKKSNEAITRNWVQIRVSDTGEGIPPEEWDRIFDKFYQIQGRSNRGSGSGLGLTISKHIIEAHSGSIWVEDSSEKGTTFVIVLPQEYAREQNESLNEFLLKRTSIQPMQTKV